MKTNIDRVNDYARGLHRGTTGDYRVYTTGAITVTKGYQSARLVEKHVGQRDNPIISQLRFPGILADGTQRWSYVSTDFLDLATNLRQMIEELLYP